MEKSQNLISTYRIQFHRDFNFDDFEVDAEYTELNAMTGFQILVMTPERCLTLIANDPSLLRVVGLVVFDEFQPLIGTNSTYLMPGEELEVTAGVGAFSKAAKPTIFKPAGYLIIIALKS